MLNNTIVAKRMDFRVNALLFISVTSKITFFLITEIIANVLVLNE